MEGVVITITQGGSTIATLTTDASGDAATILNAGVYTCTFTYPSRLPVATTITLDETTKLVFAFPSTTISGSSITTSPSFLHVSAAFWDGTTTTTVTVVEPTIETAPVFDNSAP